MEAADLARRLVHAFPPSPRSLQLEVTNLCDLDCAMCPRTRLGVRLADMDLALAERIASVLPPALEEVVLVGWGEPLLHPRFLDLVRLFKGRGVRVRTTSNGLRLGAAVRRGLIEAGLDELAVSIDDPDGAVGPGHRGASAPVENLRALSQEAGRGRPALSIQCTLHRGGEGAVLRLVELAGELGVPRVNLARLDLRLAPGLRRPSYDEEAALFARAERLGRERGVQVDLLPHGMLSGLRRLAYKGVRRALHRLDSHCFKPYDHLYVNVDGVVTPCCGLPLLSLGDVREASILDVWNGEAMARFRRDQNRVCGRCDVARIRQRA